MKKLIIFAAICLTATTAFADDPGIPDTVILACPAGRQGRQANDKNQKRRSLHPLLFDEFEYSDFASRC